MGIELGIFTFLMISTVILLSLGQGNKKSVLDKRKSQTSEMLRENVLKKKLEKITEERVKFTKRYEIETMCLQSGYKLSYDEYLLIKLASAIIFAVGIGTIMHNPIMGVMFFFIGYVVPNQALGFIKNKRIATMERQIGSFMQMVIKRYETTKDFAKALELTMVEFRGEEPLYAEIKQTVLEINLGIPVGEAMDGMARRTGNKYMARLSDYYKIASTLGTEEIRKKLLTQAYTQFEESRKAKASMKKQLAEPVREAYIMLASIPMFAVYQILTNDTYIDFMTNTFIGKAGTAGISAVFMGCIWFVNTKIGAPIE